MVAARSRGADGSRETPSTLVSPECRPRMDESRGRSASAAHAAGHGDNGKHLTATFAGGETCPNRTSGGLGRTRLSESVFIQPRDGRRWIQFEPSGAILPRFHERTRRGAVASWNRLSTRSGSHLRPQRFCVTLLALTWLLKKEST
jgi:hypothetical protein